jgi:dihydrofolate synthase/folylpolyglutamate synthase
MPLDSAASAYEAALGFLFGRLNYERPRGGTYRWPLKLERMRRLLAELGNPHDGLPIVHVAGTKGKGSTATMIAAVLTEAGFRTGLYTSPHLEQLEQRIQIDGQCCAAEELVALVEALRPAVAALDEEAGGDPNGQPTFFEITTAMSLLHFRCRRVGAAVLEVGLGGRLDSTNVCQPRVCVITSISLDHTDQLGKTLASIAREKAGIIKPGVPVVTGVTQSEPLAEIEAVAGTQAVRLRRLDREFHFDYQAPPAVNGDGCEASPARMSFTSAGVESQSQVVRLDDLQLGMWGRHQAANAAVAVETLLELRRQGWSLPDAAIRAGLQSARCPARVEVVSRRPAVVIDVAHNVASIAALIDTLDERFPRSRRVLVFAASRDKDVTGMLRLLLPRFDLVLLTQYGHNARGADPHVLLRAARRIQRELAGDASGRDASARDGASAPREILACDDAFEALERALQSAGPDDVVCITGSFFLAAQLRPRLLSAAPAPLPESSPCCASLSGDSAGLPVPKAVR